MKPFAPSSGSKGFTSHLYNFLANPDYRKLYNKFLDKTKQLKNLEANNWFLKQCLELKVIPQSFKAKQKAKDSKSDHFKQEFSKTLEKQSLELIQSTLTEDTKLVTTVAEDLTKQFNIIVNLTDSRDTYEEFRNITIIRGQTFHQHAMKQKTKKLTFLCKKQGKQTVIDIVETTSECDHEEEEDNDISDGDSPSPDTTPVTDDKSAKVENAPSNNSKKKKREWLPKNKYRRQKKKILKQKVSVVFNYSGIQLSKGAEQVLNRGLNFSILPEKLNIGELLSDIDRFERNMEWTEHFHGKDEDDEYIKPLFKKVKTNRPKNPSEGLKTCVNSIRSELKDPENRNKVRPNLSPAELQGLRELQQLQRDRVITIKPCDKGAGVIILSFDAYYNSCTKHLNSVQRQPDGSYKKYYQPLTDLDQIEDTRELIRSIIKEGLDKQYLTKDEAEAMCPDDKGVSKFYELFKVHKQHTAPHTPPERPIISGSGSMNENLGKFVESKLKEVANCHESYLQDTPHLLRLLSEANQNGLVRDGDIIVTIDVSALYTNIDQDEGLEACREALEERKCRDIPTDFILQLLEIILKHNIFEYDREYFLQVIGTAMGAVPAVSYANIFMARKIDDKILECAANLIIFMKRFLDDILMFWRGSIKKLHQFLQEINSLHPSIKFTMSHTKPPGCEECDCPEALSVPFLDTSIRIENNTIITDLFKKETDRNQYLLPSSCHPNHVTSNIPFSLALRIVRICSREEDREKRFGELRQMLLDRDYKPNIIKTAIDRARNIPRDVALQKVVRKSDSRRQVFVLTYDPRLPSANQIVKKHWRVMVQDPVLREIFPLPPLIAYRRQKNVREFVIRAKVPPPATREKRVLPGMKRCGKCVNCPYVQTGRTVSATRTEGKVQVSFNITIFLESVWRVSTALLLHTKGTKTSLQGLGARRVLGGQWMWRTTLLR